MAGKRKGRAPPGKAAKDARSRCKPEGAENGCLRTPRNSFDPCRGKPHYVVEKILSKRLNKGTPEYEVQWKGLPVDISNTWEPAKHLEAEDGQNALKSFEDNELLLLQQVSLF